jgi:hypothetical protein
VVVVVVVGVKDTFEKKYKLNVLYRICHGALRFGPIGLMTQIFLWAPKCSHRLTKSFFLQKPCPNKCFFYRKNLFPS